MKNQNFLCKMRHDFSGVGEDGVLVQGEEILYFFLKKKNTLKITFPLQNKFYDTFFYQP